MVTRILASLGILIAAVLIGGQFLSNQFQAKAVGVISAPVDQVHAMVGNLETWDKWGLG